MSKKYIVPILFFFIALFIDIFSYNEKPVSDSVDNINTFIDKSILDTKAHLFTNKNIAFLISDSFSIKEYNRIKHLENQLEKKGITSQLFQKDSLIFWNNASMEDTICTSFKSKDQTLKLCKIIFDKEGNLHKDIRDNSNLYHKIFKNKNNPEAFIGSIGIQSKTMYRSDRKNKVILFFYFFSFLILIIQSLKTKNTATIGILLGLRLLLFFFDWHIRFDDSSITQSIFAGYPYSIADLVLDALIIFGVLNVLSSYQFQKTNKTGYFSQTINGLFLTLLTISHIRLIQMLVNSEEVFNSFNDLSGLSFNDLIVLTSLLIILAGIFMYGYSLFDNLRNQAVPKKRIYLLFGIISVLTVYIGDLLKLELNNYMLLFFLCAYYLLFDLFADVKNKNITWIIWWAIFFGVYLSALFFNYEIKKELLQRHEFLKSVVHTVPYSKVKEIHNSGLLDSISDQIQNLLVLPPEARYDKSDFNAFVQEKFDNENIEIELFKEDGTNMFDLEKYKHVASRLIYVDTLMQFDEIENAVWFTLNFDGFYAKVSFSNNDSKGLIRFPFNFYKEGKIVYQDIELSPVEIQEIQSTTDEIIYVNSNGYVNYSPSTGQLLISKKSFSGIIKPIALFSLMFCLIVLLSLIISISHSIIQYLPEEWPFSIQKFDSLNSKIQISLILVILLSFVIIAAITNSFLSSYLSQEKDNYFKDKIETVANEIREQTLISKSPKESITIAANFKSKVERIHNVKLDILDLNQNENRLDYFTHAYFTKQERISPFTDKSDNKAISYLPIMFKGNPVGISSITHDQQDLQSSYVYDFLGSIFNVYVFLFLIASVIAIFIARSITKPLSLLNQKLLQLKLGKQNELIVWEKDDEIGNLISNYNNMVNQLEESAQILAKTERDSAWREMAKQVAHEIKNPLTPMRLSIQYLEKAVKQNPEEAANISKKISSTLIEQIDNLTEIANAFGNFAELPKTSNVKVELNEVVEVVHNLFRKREDMDIKLSVPIDPVYVYGDKNQLIRILNNLVKNAIESIPNTKRGKIDLKLFTKDEKSIISVSDNGIGIPNSMKDKIFQPKFTTKDSGSGLGLAICANVIESMNGRIYFESRPNEGTDFFIELDIIRQTYFQDQNKRITLD